MVASILSSHDADRGDQGDRIAQSQRCTAVHTPWPIDTIHRRRYLLTVPSAKNHDLLSRSSLQRYARSLLLTFRHCKTTTFDKVIRNEGTARSSGATPGGPGDPVGRQGVRLPGNVDGEPF